MLENTLRILKHKGVCGLLIAFFYMFKANFYRRFLGRRHLKKRIHDYWMYLDTLDQGIGRTLILFGVREEDHRIILHEVLKPGMTVLDIGANIKSPIQFLMRGMGNQTEMTVRIP